MAKKADVRLRLEALFDTLSAESPMVRHCKNCGSEMVNINLLLILANSERSWNIPLPICTKCNRDGYAKFISKEAA
jgi:hypothetical protein